MKNTFPLMALVGLLLMCGIVSCKKDDNKNNTGNPPAITLPLTCDFQTVSKSKAAVQNIGGIDYTYTVSLPGGIWQSNNTWKSCIPAGTDSFAIGGVWHGVSIHGALIADVSGLPAINKVTVKLLNDLTGSNVSTQVRLCDGSNIIAETPMNAGSGNLTLTVDVAGKKASKLYIYSGSSIVYSVLIE